MALRIAGIISDKYRDEYPKISEMLDEHLEGALNFYSYPDEHHRKIHTTNLIECLNSIIKKRSKVVKIFPNAESCIRYVGCLLMEIDEDWQTGRRYMRMDYHEENKEPLDEGFLQEIEMVKQG